MGRTLHYKMEGNYRPSVEQENKLIVLSKSYNSKFNWTCENVWLSTLEYYPNWNNFPKEMKTGDVWDLINKSYDQYLKQGQTEVEVIKSLQSDGLVNYSHKESLCGFSKTGGNELNAHTVIYFVAEASHIIPRQVFSLYDEGDALYCPILIRNGRAKPDLERIEHTLEYWKGRDYLHDGGTWDVSNAERYFHSLLRLKPSWGEITQYIRPLYRRVKPKPFKTTILHEKQSLDIKNIVEAFLLNEQKESKQYYEDVKQYPLLEVTA